VGGILPNDASITRLVVAVLLEHGEHWQLESRRMFPADRMAALLSGGFANPEGCLRVTRAS